MILLNTHISQKHLLFSQSYMNKAYFIYGWLWPNSALGEIATTMTGLWLQSLRIELLVVIGLNNIFPFLAGKRNQLDLGMWNMVELKTLEGYDVSSSCMYTTVNGKSVWTYVV